MKNKTLQFYAVLIFTAFCCTTVSSRLHATNYTYLYNSGWAVASSWLGFNKPPAVLPAGDTVFINNHCTVTEPVVVNGVVLAGDPWGMAATQDFEIGTTGVMNIYRFSFYGNLFTVNGKYNATYQTFCNRDNSTLTFNSFTELNSDLVTTSAVVIGLNGHLKMIPGTSAGFTCMNNSTGIIINGRLTMQNTLLTCSKITVGTNGLAEATAGGSIRCTNTLTNNGTLHAGAASLIYKHNVSQVFNNTGGVIKGDGTFEHSETYFGATGSTISAGSAGAGKLSLVHTASPAYEFNWGSSTYRCDINGPLQGVSYDWLAFGNSTNISNAKLEVDWGSYIPLPGQSFTILTAAAVNGHFASVSIPPVAGMVFDVIYNPASVVIVSLSTLPLQLVHFSGNRTNNSVQLQWQTTGEINTRAFVVEKNDDKRDKFIAVGTVTAKGNGQNSYQFTENDNGNGKILYRIKILDNNGSFSYSNNISIEKAIKHNVVTLYPNPAAQLLIIDPGGLLKNICVQITDASGRTVIKRQHAPAAAVYEDISGLAAGIYLVIVSCDGAIVHTEKIRKQ